MKPGEKKTGCEIYRQKTDPLWQKPEPSSQPKFYIFKSGSGSYKFKAFS